MKKDRAQKSTTREYIMKLIYQININKEDFETLEDKVCLLYTSPSPRD